VFGLTGRVQDMVPLWKKVAVTLEMDLVGYCQGVAAWHLLCALFVQNNFRARNGPVGVVTRLRTRRSGVGLWAGDR
jgi:hypothetical protein